MRVRLDHAAIFLSLSLAGSSGFAQDLPEKSAPVDQASSREAPLRNADIVKLTKLDMGDQIIIDKINQAKVVKFDLGTDALIKLKRDGVSKEVISAMLRVTTPQNQSSSGSTDAPLPPASSDEKTQVKAASDSQQETEKSSSCQAKPVTDSTKVVAGEGCKVKGINDWEGEISGVPAPNSKFAKLEIGMSIKQITDMIGPPSDQGAYMTGKAWIPFYFGSDRHRYECVYKNQGRLIFAGGTVGDFSGGHLIWIIHNSNEPAYR